jgi:hypothetical protein
MSIRLLLVRRLSEARKMALEADMERQNAFSGSLKRIAILAIVGFAVAALFYKLDGGPAQGCDLLNGAGWVVLRILRPVLVFGWQTVQAYVSDNSGCLRHLPQIVASFGSLLSGVAS